MKYVELRIFSKTTKNQHTKQYVTLRIFYKTTQHTRHPLPSTLVRHSFGVCSGKGYFRRVNPEQTPTKSRTKPL